MSAADIILGERLKTVALAFSPYAFLIKSSGFPQSLFLTI